GEGTPMSNFPDYAGPLSETILLGNLALLAGKKVEWDATNLIAKDATPEVAALVRHQYENGYAL
ncbi:MAG: gfo/Idh/MocA family oxidoreductase, partial [Planctomycetota bacterium]